MTLQGIIKSALQVVPFRWFVRNQESSEVAQKASDIIRGIAEKWASDEKKMILAEASAFAVTVVADPTRFVQASKDLYYSILSKGAQITINDAKDALSLAVQAAGGKR